MEYAGKLATDIRCHFKLNGDHLGKRADQTQKGWVDRLFSLSADLLSQLRRHGEPVRRSVGDTDTVWAEEDLLLSGELSRVQKIDYMCNLYRKNISDRGNSMFSQCLLFA